MKSFTTVREHDVDEIDLDAIVAKQIIDLKQKLGMIMFFTQTIVIN